VRTSYPKHFTYHDRRFKLRRPQGRGHVSESLRRQPSIAEAARSLFDEVET